jgi:hypothetical protein
MGLALSPHDLFRLIYGICIWFSGNYTLIIAYSLASLLGYYVAKKLKGDAIIALLREKFPLDHFS